MSFKSGFEKVAYQEKEAFVGPALRVIGGLAGRAIGGLARGGASVAGKGLSAGLRGAGKVFGGSTGPMGMLGLAAQGASTIGSFKQNQNLMQGALQR